jgi:glucuronate isomerase
MAVRLKPMAARSGGSFAENYHLFRGTPSRLWLDHAFQDVFGMMTVPVSAATADETYDHIAELPCRPEFLPRALFERFNIEAIATTEARSMICAGTR